MKTVENSSSQACCTLPSGEDWKLSTILRRSWCPTKSLWLIHQPFDPYEWMHSVHEQLSSQALDCAGMTGLTTWMKEVMRGDERQGKEGDWPGYYRWAMGDELPVCRPRWSSATPMAPDWLAGIETVWTCVVGHQTVKIWSQLSLQPEISDALNWLLIGACYNSHYCFPRVSL